MSRPRPRMRTAPAIHRSLVSCDRGETSRRLETRARARCPGCQGERSLLAAAGGSSPDFYLFGFYVACLLVALSSSEQLTEKTVSWLMISFTAGYLSLFLSRLYACFNAVISGRGDKFQDLSQAVIVFSLAWFGRDYYVSFLSF